MKETDDGTAYTFGAITSINVKGYGIGDDTTSQMEFLVKDNENGEERHLVVLTQKLHRPETFNAMVSFVSAAYFAEKEIGVEYVPHEGSGANANRVITVFSPHFKNLAKDR